MCVFVCLFPNFKHTTARFRELSLASLASAHSARSSWLRSLQRVWPYTYIYIYIYTHEDETFIALEQRPRETKYIKNAQGAMRAWPIRALPIRPREAQQGPGPERPREAHKGPAHKCPGKPTRAWGGPQGLGPQESGLWAQPIKAHGDPQGPSP